MSLRLFNAFIISPEESNRKVAGTPLASLV
jgi:hypothetical protein